MSKLNAFNAELFELENLSLDALFQPTRDFIFLYLDEIQNWLSSKKFKKKYLETKYPYPSLLDP